MNKDDFPHPFKIGEFPAHQAQALTDAQRSALPAFERQDGIPGVGFVTLTAPGEGRYTLFPERMNGDDPMTEVRYQLDPGTLTPQELSDRTVSAIEQERRMQMRRGVEIARVWSHDKAVDLLDFARRNAFDAPIEDQIVQAGFAKDSPDSPGYKKHTNGGSFSFYLQDECTLLAFDPTNKPYRHNLVLVNHYMPWADGEHCSPIYWPSTMADPYRAAVGMALRMAEIWTPDLIAEERATRKAKPKL